MSLSELLDHCVKETCCIDKINFDLKCFDLPLDQVNEMRNLMGHLASATTHKSAVGLLGSRPGHQDIGHAISMYNFCLKTQTINYKDSSMFAYKFIQTQNAPEGLPLSITNEYKGFTKDNQPLLKAWTFEAEYNEAA